MIEAALPVCKSCGNALSGRRDLDRLSIREVDGEQHVLHGECADAVMSNGEPKMALQDRLRRMLNHVGDIARKASGSRDSLAHSRVQQILERVRRAWPDLPAELDNLLSGINEDADELFNTPDLSPEAAKYRRDCIETEINASTRLVKKHLVRR